MITVDLTRRSREMAPANNIGQCTALLL